MRPRIYLDTSVIGAYVDERLPERQRATIEFWGRLSEFEVAFSGLAAAEIRETEDPKQQARMAELVQGFVELAIGEEARALAQEYIRRGVFFMATADDALHVAVAVVSRQDIIVGWNFRHLVNRRRRALINEVDILLGYPRTEILAPPEV